jgi:hypothetical protein
MDQNARSSGLCPPRFHALLFDDARLGQALLKAYWGAYHPNGSHQRIVAVPFHSPTGRVILQGLLVEMYCARVLFVRPGHYRLIVAQYFTGDITDDEAEHREVVELFFEPVKTPLAKSEILKADAGLSPRTHLLEDANEIR